MPILAHELARPLRLANLLPWEELGYHWLYLEYRPPVNRVEFGDKELSAFDSDQPANGAADAIRPVLGALREDADGRPLLVVSRVTRSSDDFRWLDLVEMIQNLDVREIGNAPQHFRGKPLSETDVCFFSTPEVVFRLGTDGLDEASGLDLLDHSNPSWIIRFFNGQARITGRKTRKGGTRASRAGEFL
jgi:hypothetical protein